MRILLVEDEESVRITLAANLELEGYEVLEASDGRRAIELLSKHPVDVVLSDIRMPHVSGLELLSHIKQHFPDLPMVMMTAYAQEAQVRAAISEGVFAVLRKPFDFDAAVSSIVRALRRPLVLVVDDQERDAWSLSEGLKSAGLRAAAVQSAREAVQIIREGNVDVCVTDLVMPEMDGTELVEQVRELAPDVTVIVLSGKDVSSMLQRVSKAGVFACLRKPVDPLELMQVVARARGGAGAL